MKAFGNDFGWIPAGLSQSQLLTTVNATNFIALGFIMGLTKTLNEVNITAVVPAGEANTTGLVCEVRPDDGTGKPDLNTLLATSNTYTSALVSGAQFVNFLGFNLSLTYGTKYFFLFKDTNAGGAIQIACVNGILQSTTGGGSTLWGCNRGVYNGSAWTMTANSGGMRLKFSDNTYSGINFNNGGSDNTNYCQAAKACGASFTTPAHAKIPIIGLGLIATKNGSPTGSLCLKLWKDSDSSLIATTQSVLYSQLTGTNWVVNYFGSIITLSPSTRYNMAFVDLGNNSSTNYIKMAPGQFEDNAANYNQIPLLARQVQTSNVNANPISWSNVAGQLAPYALIVDPDSDFGANTVGYPIIQ